MTSRRSRRSVKGLFGWVLMLGGALAACTGDDDIFAPPKSSGAPSDSGASSSSGSPGTSSSGGTGQDASPTDGSVNDAASNDGGDSGSPTDSGTDSSTPMDSGVDSGPVVCTLVACASNATCTALGCGSCNMGQGKCKN